MPDGSNPQLRDDAVLQVRDLVVDYPLARKRRVQAVSGLTFDIRAGETFALVGESGCGKSSAARAITMLGPLTSGSVVLDGVEITSMRARELRRWRRRFQMIFQDPASSLNPSRRIESIVAEGLRIQGIEVTKEHVDQLLEDVGLDPAVVARRYPSEMSGGQCQRVAMARSLAVAPAFLVADEPVSALDVSVQGQVLNLLYDLSAGEHGLSVLFISHDLSVVRRISQRIGVMYLGRLCEIGDPEGIITRPAHPYTRGLIESVPVPDPRHEPAALALRGDVPSAIDPPSGCRFHPRCERATSICATAEPELRPSGVDRFVACHHPYDESVVSIGRAT